MSEARDLDDNVTSGLLFFYPHVDQANLAFHGTFEALHRRHRGSTKESEANIQCVYFASPGA